MVRDIAKHYRIPKPALSVRSFADRGTYAQAIQSHSIEFSGRHAAWTPLIVAHEMAHIIQSYYGMIPRHADHGPQFAGTLAYILHKFGIMPVQASLPSMRHGKVRYYDPHRCRPASIRNWYKKC